MSIPELIQQLRMRPAAVVFQQVIDTINANYAYTPAAFCNGIGDDCVASAAGSNEGSCRIFAFAKLNALNEAETLACFGEHYRAVLNTPDGSDHANIRTFMRYGWKGIAFGGSALQSK